MKKLLIIIGLALASLMQAQTYGEPGYEFLYDYDHRVVIRSTVECKEEYQGLWNGDYVRLKSGHVYIYRNGQSLLLGDKVRLEHTGQYVVDRGGRLYLYDAQGRNTDAWADELTVLWNKCICVRRGNLYYLLNETGRRIGNVYSDKPIILYWNGYYAVYQGGRYYIVNPDGEKVSGCYSDKEPELIPGGYFRVVRSSMYYLVDTKGNKVY